VLCVRIDNAVAWIGAAAVARIGVPMVWLGKEEADLPGAIGAAGGMIGRVFGNCAGELGHAVALPPAGVSRLASAGARRLGERETVVRGTVARQAPLADSCWGGRAARAF